MLYILLAGGIFNAVLVPQLVRAMKNDADGGEAYTNRIMTLAGLFLGAVTILLVVAAPWVMSLFLDPEYDTAKLAAQHESIIAFARFCLPQVFFYGMFVLVGQILNSRGRFGPMMWAPIANNLIAVARARALPRGLRADRGTERRRRLHLRPGGPARPRLHPRHRRPAADPAALPVGGRLPLPAALRLPRHRPRAHAAARGLDRAVRGGQPDRVHRGGPAGLRRYRRRATGRRRHRLHGLLADVPDRDGAALRDHGVAGDRDPAPAQRATPPTPTSRRSPARWASRCAAPSRS